MPLCSHCRREVASDAQFCPHCGKRDPAEIVSPPTTDTGCGGCFLLAVRASVVAFIAGVAYPWYTKTPADHMALDTLKAAVVCAVITGVITFIERKRTGR